MRILHFILMMFMILFMAVQYNDPDGLLWIAIYSVPAIWCAVAAFWRPGLAGPKAGSALMLCLAGSVALTVYYWPATPRFWRQDVWWEVETAREGMGMMIVTMVLLLVAAEFIRQGRKIASVGKLKPEPTERPTVPAQNH